METGEQRNNEGRRKTNGRIKRNGNRLKKYRSANEKRYRIGKMKERKEEGKDKRGGGGDNKM